MMDEHESAVLDRHIVWKANRADFLWHEINNWFEQYGYVIALNPEIGWIAQSTKDADKGSNTPVFNTLAALMDFVRDGA